ncbi:hypothetical protein AAFO92_02475 [Roseovarius sp. CAU 1744]|uniref:hypothetical protein n=1 Tax=Roseovarius sp. CAU 1744 TaxID=3140368 RepID=UPI00325AA29A
MQGVRLIGYLLMALASGVPAARAADVALILGDTGQTATLRNDTSITSVDFAAPLRQAGFEIIQPRNRSSGNMRLAAQRVEAALAAGTVNRLVIVVMGPVASSARESWALSNGAAGASSLNIGVTGIPLGALSDMAAAAKGQAVILIAPGRAVDTLGLGLEPGLTDLKAAPGVTYVTGPADLLTETLTDGLLTAGRSFDDIARDAPQGVSVTGFVSGEVGLMGQE